MARTFLRLVSGKWDEVDAFTAKNWKHAVNSFDKKEQRYDGTCVSINDDGFIKIDGSMQPQDLVWIMRFLGINPLNPDVKIPGGMLNEPMIMMFVINGRNIIRQNGITFIAKAA